MPITSFNIYDDAHKKRAGKPALFINLMSLRFYFFSSRSLASLITSSDIFLGQGM